MTAEAPDLLMEMIRRTSPVVLRIFRQNGFILAPYWDVETAAGERAIVNHPRKATVAEDVTAVRTAFAMMRVVRYVQVGEAVMVEQYTGRNQVRLSREDDPTLDGRQREAVVISAEDRELGMLIGYRVIRRGEGKPSLGPLRFWPYDATLTGPMTGLLAHNRGTVQ